MARLLDEKHHVDTCCMAFICLGQQQTSMCCVSDACAYSAAGGITTIKGGSESVVKMREKEKNIEGSYFRLRVNVIAKN